MASNEVIRNWVIAIVVITVVLLSALSGGAYIGYRKGFRLTKHGFKNTHQGTDYRNKRLDKQYLAHQSPEGIQIRNQYEVSYIPSRANIDRPLPNRPPVPADVVNIDDQFRRMYSGKLGNDRIYGVRRVPITSLDTEVAPPLPNRNGPGPNTRVNTYVNNNPISSDNLGNAPPVPTVIKGRNGRMENVYGPLPKAPSPPR